MVAKQSTELSKALRCEIICNFWTAPQGMQSQLTSGGCGSGSGLIEGLWLERSLLFRPREEELSFPRHSISGPENDLLPLHHNPIMKGNVWVTN